MCFLPEVLELRFLISKRRRLLLFAFLASGLLVAAVVFAQQQSQPSYSVHVKVVNVPTTVRDKHGQIVRDLTKNDFIVEEDGRPQEIRYFSQESDLPLTLGLLVDTSLSQRRVLDDERRASDTFLGRMLREDKDRAFLIHFDRYVELLQDLTSSRDKLQSALNDLHTPQTQPYDQGQGGGGSGGGGGYPGGGNGPWGGRFPGGGGGGGYPGGGGHRRGGHNGARQPGTVLYDAVYLGSNELMSKQQGRKAVIILSDGVDIGSKVPLEKGIEAAQRSDTIVYSILFADDEAYSNSGFGGFGGGRRHRLPEEQRPDGKKVLERISQETGGRMFQVSKKLPIENIYSQIEDELRSQYNLGYTPDRADLEPGYHKLEVKAKPKDLTVQARAGYYYQPKVANADADADGARSSSK